MLNWEHRSPNARDEHTQFCFMVVDHTPDLPDDLLTAVRTMTTGDRHLFHSCHAKDGIVSLAVHRLINADSRVVMLQKEPEVICCWQIKQIDKKGSDGG